MISFRVLRRAVLAGTALVVLALAVGGLRVRHIAEAHGRAAAGELVERAARVAEGILNRHLLQVDGAVAVLPTLLEALPTDASDPAWRDGAARLLAELSSQSFIYRNLFVLGPDGALLVSGDAALRRSPIPLSELVPASPGGAALAGPVRSRQTGEETLFVARPVDLRGRPGALAVAEVPVSVIAAMLGPVETPASLRLRVETPDGRVVAAGLGQMQLVGQRLEAPLGADGTGGAAERRPDRLLPGRWTYAAAVRIHYAGLLAVVALPEDVALEEARAEGGKALAVAGGLAVMVAALGVALALVLQAREATEQERAASRATLEAALEALPNGFVMWDADDRLVVCNSAYRRYYARSAPSLRPGVTFEEVIRYGAEAGQYPQMTGDVDEFVRNLVRWHRSGDVELERMLPDGRWIHVAEKRMPGGGTVGIRTDVTAFKTAVEEQARLRALADDAKTAKSRMVAHVSHELRTPLAGLMSLSEDALADPALSPEQRRRATELGAAARHILAIANEVLDLAAMEAGRLTLSEEVASPRGLAEDALAMIRPVAGRKGVELALETEGLPPFVHADPLRLRQVLLNLLSNAVKFSPPRGTARLRLAASGGWLRVEVTDEGPGIPEADRARLFGDFVRLAPRETDGTGLGLAISARLVDLMGGTIACDDNPSGAGARFTVALPLREAPAPEPRPAAPEALRLRALAVDDTPANLAVLRLLLAPTGCELETVTDAAAAIEILAEAAREGEPFDVVLMDVMMPGMDGLEATRRIRAMPGAMGRVPVVAVTAGAFPEDVAACLAAGMNAHVPKPVSQRALLDALAAAVPKARPGGRGAAAAALAGLRPAFLREASGRLRELEDPAADLDAKAAAAHALVAAAGGLGLDRLAEEARLAMQALRKRDADAARRAAELAAQLREALGPVAA